MQNAARDDHNDDNSFIFGLGATLFQMLRADQQKVRGRSNVLYLVLEPPCRAVEATIVFLLNKNRRYRRERYVYGCLYLTTSFLRGETRVEVRASWSINIGQSVRIKNSTK